jgi:hypothetical protein
MKFDDVYVNVPAFDNYVRIEIFNLPEPTTHLVMRGSCFECCDGYFLLQGGVGFLSSWLLCATLNKLQFELIRLNCLCDDWVLIHWCMILGLSRYEMASPFMYGYTEFFYYSININIDELPICDLSILSLSNPCFQKNYFQDPSNVIFFHTENRNFTQYSKIFDKFNGKNVFYDVITLKFCKGKGNKLLLPEDAVYYNIHFMDKIAMKR